LRGPCPPLEPTADGYRRRRRLPPQTQPQGASAILTEVELIIGVVRTSVGPYFPGAPAHVARTSAVWPSRMSTVNFSAGRPRSVTDGPVVVSRPGSGASTAVVVAPTGP